MSMLTDAKRAKLLKLFGTAKEAYQKIEEILQEVPVQDRQEFEKVIESLFKQ